MSKKINISLIRQRRVYSTQELAGLFKVHPRTIQAWKKEGMQPLEENKRPCSYLGLYVKDFLRKKQKKRRKKLNIDQFYCLKCRRETMSEPGALKYLITEQELGNGSKHAKITGKCIACGTGLYRFASDKIIKKMISLNILKEGSKGLLSNSAPSSNTDLEGVSKMRESEQLSLGF